MTEIQLVYMAWLRLLIAAFIGFVYSRAGRGWKLPIFGKIRRRIYLPLIYCITMLVISIVAGRFSLNLLLSIVATWGIYYGTLSVGYGASSWLRKVFGRIGQQFIVGALQGSSCILLAIATGHWGLYTLSIVVPSLTLGTLGGWADDDTNASYKESLVGISLFLFPLFLI